MTTTITMPAATLKKIVKAVAPAASSEDDQPVLTGVRSSLHGLGVLDLLIMPARVR